MADCKRSDSYSDRELGQKNSAKGPMLEGETARVAVTSPPKLPETLKLGIPAKSEPVELATLLTQLSFGPARTRS